MIGFVLWVNFEGSEVSCLERPSQNRQMFEEFLEDPLIFSAFASASLLDYNCLPFGAIVATTEMEDCVPTEMISNLSDLERMLGDFSPGRFGWVLNQVRRLDKPIPVCGSQGFFFVNVPVPKVTF